ncbi:hypothetical protein HMPREF1988_02030, partial [Porphyromonas gingivalis F0185]
MHHTGIKTVHIWEDTGRVTADFNCTIQELKRHVLMFCGRNTKYFNCTIQEL